MLCNVLPHLECGHCPFVSCNNHPQFFMALQCATRSRKMHCDEKPHSNRQSAA
jgi:hypothetical protein